MTEDEPVLLGDKAAALTHPQEPRATLAAWMMLGDAQKSTQRSAEGDECVREYDEWAADLARRVPAEREHWMKRLFLRGRR